VTTPPTIESRGVTSVKRTRTALRDCTIDVLGQFVETLPGGQRAGIDIVEASGGAQ
jgi:hypothetical protein